MKIECGYSFYGQPLGVLVFRQKTPRIPGDPGHNGTFPYPVCYEVVTGGFAALVEGSEEIKQALLNGARSLKEKGVRAIVGDCGLMSLYQRELAQETGLPVLASALSLIPTVWTMIGQSGSIGVLTGHSELLSERHLTASGVTADMRLSIQGLQDEPHFAKTVIGGSPELVPAEMCRDVLSAGKKLLAKTPDLRAVVVECSNLPTYSKALFEEYGIPVFDIVSAAELLQRSVQPPSYGDGAVAR